MDPVCVRCQIQMPKYRVGVMVEEMMDGDMPYKVWNADIRKCPQCEIEIVSDFAQSPASEHFRTDYIPWAKRCILQFWSSLRGKPERIA